MIVFSFIAIYGIYGNTQRLHDIQQSRIRSCQQTYSKLTEIMHLSIDGRTIRPEQQERVDRIFAAIDPKQCVQQTSVPSHAFPFQFVQDALAGN